MFTVYDKNYDGKLDIEEFTELYARADVQLPDSNDDDSTDPDPPMPDPDDGSDDGTDPDPPMPNPDDGSDDGSIPDESDNNNECDE